MHPDAGRLMTSSFQYGGGSAAHVPNRSFVPPPQRDNSNNLYVKNFTESDIPDEGTLRALFGDYGEITSTFMPRAADGHQRGFAFVCFRDPSQAAAALNALNNKTMPSGQELYVNVAIKKSDQMPTTGGYVGHPSGPVKNQFLDPSNLYVKNLPDSVASDDHLRLAFEGFGAIRSAKVATDSNGRSRGFGFVAFERPADSARAMTTMNNRLIGGKVLWVGIAQRRAERQQLLMEQFRQKQLMFNSSQLVGGGGSGLSGGVSMASVNGLVQFQYPAAMLMRPVPNMTVGYQNGAVDNCGPNKSNQSNEKQIASTDNDGQQSVPRFMVPERYQNSAKCQESGDNQGASSSSAKCQPKNVVSRGGNGPQRRSSFRDATHRIARFLPGSRFNRNQDRKSHQSDNENQKSESATTLFERLSLADCDQVAQDRARAMEAAAAIVGGSTSAAVAVDRN